MNPSDSQNGSLSASGTGHVTDPFGASSFRVSMRRGPPSGPGACLAGMLAASPASRNAALVFLGRSGDRQLDSELGGLVNSEVVRGVLADRSRWAVEGRIALAGLPWQPAGTGAELWDGLLGDPEPAVVAAAIDGIGRRGEINRAPWLLKQLDQAALHGVLVVIRDLGLKLVSVNRAGDTTSAAPQEMPNAR